MGNLLADAAESSPADTWVEIELSTPEPDTVRLAVRDHVPGIPPLFAAALATLRAMGNTAAHGFSTYTLRRAVPYRPREPPHPLPPAVSAACPRQRPAMGLTPAGGREVTHLAGRQDPC